MQTATSFLIALKKRPSLYKGLLFCILAVLFIPHWVISYNHLNHTIGPDLLLRTIGSRLQQAGKPIYSYKWVPGDPVAWLNPYGDARVGVNGVVSTPFLLWLLQPLARLNYCSIKFLWSCIEELILFATAWFCCGLFKKLLPQLAFMAIAIVFFIYDRNWQLHFYNGQMYVLYAFTFSVAAYIVSNKNPTQWVPVIFTFVSLIRPFFITAIIPFINLRKKAIVFFVVSVALAILTVVATTQLDEWKQYNSAMKLYAKEETKELSVENTPYRLYWTYADTCTKINEASFTVFGAGCLFSVQHYLRLVGISVSSVFVYQEILLVTFVIILFAAYKKKLLQDKYKQLLLSFLLYQLCTLITPASRNPYCMVEWLPVVAILISKANRQIVMTIIAGLCLNHDFPFWFKYERELGEALLFAALIFSLNKKDFVEVSKVE